jgi:hypothetical protein
MNKIETIQPKYSEDEIQEFESENNYMDAFVELLKQTILTFWQIIHLKYCDEEGMPIIIEKEDAIIGGNLMRLIKLNTSFLENICNGKSEICFILNRCIAETSINIKYMLVEGEERVRKNYIKHSLITEKELWETIKSNTIERNGDILPIETRMQNSIQNSFDKSDFEIDDVNKSSKWKSMKSRAEVVAGEMFYSVFYGISSHSIHGNWQDILFNNLTKEENGFKLKLNYQEPRPQIVEAPIVLNIDLIRLFVEKELVNSNSKDILLENCNILSLYQKTLTENHEKSLEQ